MNSLSLRRVDSILTVLLFASFVECAHGSAQQGAVDEDARQRLVEQRAAAATLRESVRGNPYDGRLWRRLGFALRPLGEGEAAIDCWRKAIELGDSPAENTYNIACIYATSNRRDEALRELGRALDAGFAEQETLRNDSDMDPLRADPRFQRLTGLGTPEGLDRSERWRYDLDFFRRRMEQMHYRLYAHVTRERFQSEVDDLAAHVQSLSDDAIRTRLQKIVVLAGDGHTRVASLAEGQAWIERLPLDMYLYSDGLLVRGAPPPLRALVGARVLRIGDVDVEAALAALHPYTSVDNPMGYRDWAPSLLTRPGELEAIGARTGSGPVALTVRTVDGREEKVDVELRKFTAEDLSGRRRASFVYANDAAKAPLPLYLQHPDRNLAIDDIDDGRGDGRGGRAVYFWFGGVAGDADRSFEDTVRALFEHIEERKSDYLVIDMRQNDGGDTGLVLPLVHGLIRCDRVNRDGHLFVIIGRQTFSAAMNAVSLIELHTAATFVGEPTGSSPNFVGESTYFVLPFSRVRVYCSSRYWQHVTSLDRRIWIAPDIAVELSSKDFAENRDPILEAVLARCATPR